jgi:hypothetical protein
VRYIIIITITWARQEKKGTKAEKKPISVDVLTEKNLRVGKVNGLPLVLVPPFLV